MSLLGSRGGKPGGEGGKVEDRKKKEIDIERGKRRESGKDDGEGGREGNGERRWEGEGEKSVM